MARAVKSGLFVVSIVSAVGVTWWAGQQGATWPALAGAVGIATTTYLLRADGQWTTNWKA
jgi:hypothetical protein